MKTPCAPRTALLAALLLSGCSSDTPADTAEPTPDPPLTIEVSGVPESTEGEPFTLTLRAQGGSGAGYAWSLAEGSLPPGVAGLPASGDLATLTGVPSLDGEFAFTVELRDSAQRAVQRALNLRVASRPVTAAVWSSTSTVDAPTPRAHHSAVWTGDEMLVWGGFEPGGFLDSGAAYDPQLDAWRPLSGDGAPEPRFGHTALWTGTEMIVWGGQVFGEPTNAGAAYDPLTGAWRTLSSAGAPEARTLHSAVWTGTQMLVWGGEGKASGGNAVALVYANGGAYDPNTDQWGPVPEPELFAARGHTAVWTGLEMLVWGGRNAIATTVQTLASGRAYAPAGGVWSPLTDAQAPAPRMDHTAVWTGFPRAEMIVWGGFTDPGPTSNALKTGGRYPLVGAEWSPTAKIRAPSARGNHTAVWTGEEMLVWGGASAGLAGPLGGGGAYDPLEDAWRDLPSESEPAARFEHTAVWTGSQMIVWGGWAEFGVRPLDTGGVLSFQN